MGGAFRHGGRSPAFRGKKIELAAEALHGDGPRPIRGAIPGHDRVVHEHDRAMLASTAMEIARDGVDHLGFITVAMRVCQNSAYAIATSAVSIRHDKFLW